MFAADCVSPLCFFLSWFFLSWFCVSNQQNGSARATGPRTRRAGSESKTCKPRTICPRRPDHFFFPGFFLSWFCVFQAAEWQHSGAQDHERVEREANPRRAYQGQSALDVPTPNGRNYLFLLPWTALTRVIDPMLNRSLACGEPLQSKCVDCVAIEQY